MGIENLHILIDPDEQVKRGEVSRHKDTGETERYIFVYGWDHPLQSFYLQKHDLTREEDDQVIVRLGTADSQMYEVEDLVREAKKHGLYISHQTRVKLYGEKDDGA